MQLQWNSIRVSNFSLEFNFLNFKVRDWNKKLSDVINDKSKFC
jgi:hypothetical protein